MDTHVVYMCLCIYIYAYMNIHAGRQTNRQTDGHAYRQAGRQADNQTYLHTYIHILHRDAAKLAVLQPSSHRQKTLAKTQARAARS